jgi:hypothetical protein
MDASSFYTPFAAYNTDWLMVNVVLWLLLVIATVAVLAKPGNERANMLIKGVLALVFLWNSLVFFFGYMTVSAIAGGIPFFVAGILLAADVVRRRIRIALPASGWLRYATLAWVVWALGLYTVAGWLEGHPYPGGPLPNAPCPATILAIALLATSMATLKIDRLYFGLLFAMLLWWAFFAGIFTPALFGFYVDLTLLAAGIYGLAMIWMNWRAPAKAGS